VIPCQVFAVHCYKSRKERDSVNCVCTAYVRCVCEVLSARFSG